MVHLTIRQRFRIHDSNGGDAQTEVFVVQRETKIPFLTTVQGVIKIPKRKGGILTLHVSNSGDSYVEVIENSNKLIYWTPTIDISIDRSGPTFEDYKQDGAEIVKHFTEFKLAGFTPVEGDPRDN